MKSSIVRPLIDRLEARQHLSRNQVVGYLTNYSLGSTIDINKIDYSALTQINYFAAIPSNDGDITFTKAEAQKLSAVIAKAHSHGVKVSLALGGANQDASLTAIIGSQEGGNTTAHTHLASELNDVMTQYGIDGVDVDWEPLATTTTAIANYGKLLKTLQDNTTLQVSAAVAAERLWTVVGSPDGRGFVLDQTAVESVDQIGVMAYDLETDNHSAWPRSTNSLTGWATYVESFGQSREKLLFGLPYYGRSGSAWNNPQPSYRKLIDNRLAQNPGTTISPNADSLWVAFPEYAYNGGQGAEWFFNGKNTINAKTNFAMDQNVGGVMIWDLAQDHTDSNLNYTGYSLLPGIRDTVNARGTVSATASFDVDAQKQSVKFNFNAVLDSSTMGKADLAVTNLATGASFAPTILQHVNQQVTWSFATVLPDGNYRATLRAGSVRTASGNPLAANVTADFFVLAGDADRNRVVNFDDLLIVAQNYSRANMHFSQGDFNYDGTVGFDDLLVTAQGYGKSLPASVFSISPIGSTKPSRIAGDVLV